MIRRTLLLFALPLVTGLWAQTQTPPPTPAQQELQAPLDLNDGKPTPNPAQTPEPSGWRALGSLLLVGGVVGGGLYLLKRYGTKRLPGTGGTRLKIEESLALGDRRFVSILRADDETFLIALAPSGVTLLSRLHGNAPASFEVPLDATLDRPMPIKELEKLMQEGRP